MKAWRPYQNYQTKRIDREEAIYCLKCLAGCLLILAFAVLLIVIGG